MRQSIWRLGWKNDFRSVVFCAVKPSPYYWLRFEPKVLKQHLWWTKQWPLAPNLPKWRITRANVSRRVTFLSKVANVEREQMYRVRGKWLANVGKCIESGESGWRMSGECIESGESGWQMSGECIESDQNRLANVGASKIGRFMHK